MKLAARNISILFLSITLCAGIGIFFIILNANPAQDTRFDELKANAISHTLKDSEGNLITSKDSVQQSLLLQTEEFQISYQKAYDLFLVSINASPFEDVRKQAEIAFLSLMQNNKKAACSFHVEIVTPFFANPELAGQQFPLSFCTP